MDEATSRPCREWKRAGYTPGAEPTHPPTPDYWHRDDLLLRKSHQAELKRPRTDLGALLSSIMLLYMQRCMPVGCNSVRELLCIRRPPKYFLSAMPMVYTCPTPGRLHGNGSLLNNIKVRFTVSTTVYPISHHKHRCNVPGLIGKHAIAVSTGRRL